MERRVEIMTIGRMKIIAISVVMIIMLALLCACNGNGTTEPTSTPTGSVTPPEDVEIIIGNLTDLTGVSAAAQERWP